MPLVPFRFVPVKKVDVRQPFTVADPGGVHWVPWNPSFIKGCHQKYQHAQTHYIHYAHARASFTVAITHDLPVSTQ